MSADTDDDTQQRGELSYAQEEDLLEAMLRHQVCIDPHHVGAVLDVAAVGLVNSAWRNSPWRTGTRATVP